MPIVRNLTENLVNRIRNLIYDYDSGSLLKEYLQNSDDAKATELIITYDRTIYKKLSGTKFEKASGPALILSNNSLFREKDFNSIEEIGAQGKMSDAHSTGRFGHGFSSSFSVSDHPSFISRDRIYWFDVTKEAVCENEDGSFLIWEEEEFLQISDWLDVFKVADLKEHKYYNGTIFRLPLRTEETAQESKISSQIFSHEDFLKWCEEWKDGAENLLFLRNIKRLVLREIDENGKEIVHLEISTKNSTEIEKINNDIQSEFKADPLDICNNWIKTDQVLPLSKYIHEFEISYHSAGEDSIVKSSEKWAVVNGLFRGENNDLIEQAIKALNISPEPRKVLPWAGVALKLDTNNKPVLQNNQWYSFLPLPLHSDYPVHLHGWFDLDSDRTELTSSGEGSDLKILRTWNELLLEQGVGVAWALLLDFIKNNDFLESYYSFWPKHTGISNLDKSLIEGFYKKASELDSLNVKYKETSQWDKPTNEVYYLKDDDEKLYDAFQEHFKIIQPTPKSNIISGFKKVGITLKEITPKQIRNYLQESTSVNKLPILQKDTEIVMLSKKDWFISILHYCVSDMGNDYSTLEDLPLQLTSDGYISVVGSYEVLFDGKADFELYQNREDFILDQDLVEAIQDYERLPNSWLEANLKNIIHLLIEYGKEFKLTSEWIHHVVKVIVSYKNEIDDARDNLNSLPIIYQEDKKWRTLGIDLENRSPIFIEGEDKNNININILKNVGMNVIHPDYIEIYKPLAELKLIDELSPETLVYYLLEQPSYDFLNDDKSREFILNILMKNTSWYDKMNKFERKVFKAIPFIKTISNQLFSLESDKLFIATEFKPPEDIEGFIGQFELIKTNSVDELKFYTKMGIKEQTVNNYIRNVIIDFLENSENNDAVVKIWKWLINEWSSITLNMDSEQETKMINHFRRTRIIPDSSEAHSRHKASEMYLPSLELPSCLDDASYYPIIFEDHELQYKWERILLELNTSNIVFSDHIVRKVMQIANQKDEKAYSDAIEVLNYIIGHFDEIDELKNSGKSLLETLKNFDWFPVAKPEKYFMHPSTSYKPLMNAKDLIKQGDANIMGGTYYVVNENIKFKQNENIRYEDVRKIVKRLGIVVDFKIEKVYDNFRKLLQIKAENEDEEREIFNHAIAFYQYIGRRDKIQESEIPLDILDEAIRINKYWVSPDYVFETKTKLSGIYSWDSLFDNIDSIKKRDELIAGLHKLGVKQYPGTDILAELLKRLPLDTVLNKDDLKQAKRILTELQKSDDIQVLESIPLLSTDEVLIASSELFIDDLPAYHKAKEKNENIKFCALKYKQLAKKLNVRSLHEIHRSTINQEFTQQATQLNIESSNMLKIIKSQYFKKAILRLLFSEDKIIEEDIEFAYLDDVLPTKIHFVKELVIDYFIDDEFLFRDYYATTYREKTEHILYVLEQEDKEDVANGISSYICHESDFSIEVSQIISKILRKNLNNEEVKNLLDYTHFKPLPDDKDLEIDEDEAMYYEENEEEIQVGNSYFTPNNEHEEFENGEDDQEIDDGTDHKVNIDQEISEETDHAEGSTSVSEAPSKTPNKHGVSKSRNKTTNTSGYKPTDSFIPDINTNTIEGLAIIDDILKTGDAETQEVQPPIDPLSANENAGNNSSSNPSNGGTRNNTGRNYSGNNNTNNGSGNISNSDDLISSNDFKPVYLGKEREKESERTEEERTRSKKIGKKGEQLILSRKDLLLSQYNYFEEAGQNNPGYDIVEKSRTGEVIRYIEVKSLTGSWGSGGVALTPTQLKHALKSDLRNEWWLFVVEGINTNSIQIFQFKNPVIEANKFMFDKSWKQLAFQPSNVDEVKIPKKDECYEVLEDGIRRKYIITRVKSAGEIAKVWAKRADQFSPKIVEYNSSWRKCDG